MEVDGNGTSGVMIVAEALGYNEAKQSKPLVGPAGFMFRRVLKRFVKMERDEFWLANAIWCQPPKNRTPTQAELDHCAPNLDGAIAKLKPKAIVAMGDVAARRLGCPPDGIQKTQNYAFWNEQYQAWVVPALHPAFIMRGNNKYQPILGHAINKAVRIAKEGYSYEKIRAIKEPTATQLEEWVEGYKAALKADPETVLAFDIETLWKGAKDESKIKEGEDPTYDIMQISFAYGGDEGIAVAWDPANHPHIRAALGTDGQKIVWNRSYDVPRLRANDTPINGPIRDTMIAWHALQSDMDKGLGFVTPLIPENHRIPYWKGANEDDGGWWYSAMDSAMLWRNDHHIIKSLKAEGIYDFFKNYVEDVRPVLDDMEDAGVLVDPERQAQFIVDTEDALHTIEDEMQQHVGPELRNLHPKHGYRSLPKELKGGIIETKLNFRHDYKQIVVKDQVYKECPVCKMKNPPKPHFKEYVSKAHLHKNTACSGNAAVEVHGDEYRWAKILPFKPSPGQLMRYAIAKGYKLRKNYKTDNYTMDEETLTKMLKKHPKDPLFPLVLKHRGVQKEFGLYGPDGLLIGDDGRVHTHFSDNPSTFRFASYGPNMQNIPRDSQVRSLFTAAPGHLLGARDFSGIEAVLVGYFAGDRDYTRLAKMGVHDYFNAHIAVDRGDMPPSDLPDLSMDDEELSAYLQSLKSTLKHTRPIAKMGVHMSNYIGSPVRLFQQAPGLFGSVKGAERIQGLYFDVFPSIQKWQRATCLLAERQSYVRSPFGLPHRFYQVYTYERNPDTLKWEKKLGPDAKRAVAFNPQHTAAAIMRRSIRDLAGGISRPFLRLTIHDELLWECPTERMEEVDEEIREVMERPNTHLKLPPDWGMGDYLTVGTEAKFGKRWGEME